MTLLRRTILGATGAARLLWMTVTRAQQKLIRMVVPLTPGTTPDTIARAIGPVVQAKLDMNYVVDNKAGASGMISMGLLPSPPIPARCSLFRPRRSPCHLFTKQSTSM